MDIIKTKDLTKKFNDLTAVDNITFSQQINISTTPVWADVVGNFTEGVWQPPDGKVDDNDKQAILEGFSHAETAPPLVWLDLAGKTTDGTPDRVIDLDDILAVLDAMEGKGYPYNPN